MRVISKFTLLSNNRSLNLWRITAHAQYLNKYCIHVMKLAVKLEIGMEGQFMMGVQDKAVKFMLRRFFSVRLAEADAKTIDLLHSGDFTTISMCPSTLLSRCSRRAFRPPKSTTMLMYPVSRLKHDGEHDFGYDQEPGALASLLFDDLGWFFDC